MTCFSLFSQDIVCSMNPCMNGGTCRDGEDGIKCECAEGYYGFVCQKSKELDDSI